MSKLIKIPKLKSGNDEKVAEKLDALITDANDGLRRIVAVGFFLELIAANLKHGEFKPWIEAHCKQSSRASIFGWRLLARNIMGSVKMSKVQLLDFSVPVHEMLALPLAKVPEDQKEIRQAIDGLIEGKTGRQLFAEYKQTKGPDEDGNMTPQRGNPASKGKRKLTLEEQAVALKQMAEESWAVIEGTFKTNGAAFCSRDDLDVTSEIAVLDQEAAARRAWLKQPKTKRDVKAIEELLCK